MMAKVPNAVEILQKNRQTTDRRAIAYSEREREFTFAKNY